MSSELEALTAALATAQDSTSMQIGQLRYVIGWMEETQVASSSALITALSRLRERAPVPASLMSVSELAATGRLGAIHDAGTRTRLLALDRQLEKLAAVSEPVFEAYRQRLEQEISPGMWHYMFYGESGRYAVDYRATLRDLDANGFERVLRSLLRSLLDQQTRLEAAARENAALLALLRPGSVARSQ